MQTKGYVTGSRMQWSSWRVRTKLSSKLSDALRCLGSVLRAWFTSLGLCRATGRHGNRGNRPALAIDLGNGPGPRQPHSSPPWLSASSSEKRRCVPALWSSHNIHWRTWERFLRVPFAASGRRGGGGVQMEQALSSPHPTTSGSIREAPFWLRNKTFNERIAWFKNVRRTRQPGQCVSNCHLDRLMGHTICWVALVKDTLADVMNKPKM